jgi:hypothetical protein
MVGGYALRSALEHPAVERVTVTGRRTLGISHTKLEFAGVGLPAVVRRKIDQSTAIVAGSAKNSERANFPLKS